MKLFAIYDSKADTFGPLIQKDNAAVALRELTDIVNDNEKSSPFSAHPEDYTLFELGEYDVQSGNLEIHEARKSLSLLLDLKRKQN